MSLELYSLASSIAKKTYWIKKNLKPKKASRIANVTYFRITRPLLRAYYNLFKMSHPGTPWTSPASIAFFEKALTKDMVGFEYGSGRSTKFFASRLKHLVSLEHDQAWYERVKYELTQDKITNVDYHLIEKKESTNETEETIALEGTSLTHSFLESFYIYSGFISKFPDQHFDFILVDGRARVDCIIRSIAKLKVGGVLILDNSERDRYTKAFDLLKRWPVVFTTTGVTDTTLWFKPK